MTYLRRIRQLKVERKGSCRDTQRAQQLNSHEPVAVGEEDA